MAEKFSPEMVNLVIDVVEALNKRSSHDDLRKGLDLLKERGYLDKEEETKVSVADEKWEIIEEPGKPFCIRSITSDFIVATGIHYREAAEPIAAMPELVKAARAILKHTWNWDDPPAFVVLAKEALEKAGEKL